MVTSKAQIKNTKQKHEKHNLIENQLHFNYVNHDPCTATTPPLTLKVHGMIIELSKIYR